MSISNEKLKAYLDGRFDRIEQLLKGIYSILEANADASQDAHDIRQRLQKSQEKIRQLDYEKWFLENQDTVSTTINTNKKL